jgi:hypothetical protein
LVVPVGFLRSPERLRIETEFPAVVAARWVLGQPVAFLTLARDLGAIRLRPEGEEATSHMFDDALAALVRDQIAVPGLEGRAHYPWIWNWTGEPYATATLAPALRAYLADPAIAKADKTGVRTALRKVLPLMTGDSLPDRSQSEASDERFVQAAARVPAGRAVEVLQRARQVRADGEYGRLVRKLLEYAAVRRLLPLVFPPPRGEDRWDAFRNRVWPLSARRATSARVKRCRNFWNAFKAAAVDLHGAAVLERDPNELLPHEALAVIRHARTRLGQLAAPPQMRAVLLTLRDEHAEGPFRTVPPSPFTARGTSGRTVFLYLRHPAELGSGAEFGRPVRTGDWDDLLAAIVAHGLPREPWESFLAWYREYCLLDARAYKARQQVAPTEYPVRPAVRHLKAVSFSTRFVAVRLWLGVEIHLHLREGLSELPEGVHALAADAQASARAARVAEQKAALTPERIFGPRFVPVMQRATEWWAARAKFAEQRREAGLPEEETVSHESSGGIHTSVVTAGLIALALFDRARVRRGAAAMPVKGLAAGEPADSLTRRESAGVDVLGALLEGNLTHAEQALAEAYSASIAEGTNMIATRIRDNEDTASPNTRKNIVAMLEQTPAEWWVTAYQVMLRGCEPLVHRDGAKLSEAERLLIAHTFAFGVFIATGGRESEVYGAELDGNFDRRTRNYRMRAGQRKNRKPLLGRLHRCVIPDWLLDLYLDVVRPTLVASVGVDCGRLLVNSGGRPLRGSSGLAMLEAIAAAAVSAGLTIPADPSTFGEHAIRLAMGHRMRREYGTEAAAQFLGDTKAVVEKMYSIFDGRELDHSGLQCDANLFPVPSALPRSGTLPAGAGGSARKDRPPTPATTPASRVQTPRGYSVELGVLLAAKQAGDVDAAEYAEAKRDLARRYDVRHGELN